MRQAFQKSLKKEALIYSVIVILLSLSMHPERIAIVSDITQLIHPFLYSFAVYLLVWPFRIMGSKFLRNFKS